MQHDTTRREPPNIATDSTAFLSPAGTFSFVVAYIAPARGEASFHVVTLHTSQE